MATTKEQLEKQKRQLIEKIAISTESALETRFAQYHVHNINSAKSALAAVNLALKSL